MIGKTGVGKSATCNTMTRTQNFKSDSSGKSVTQKGKLGKMNWQNKKFKIVDTPGLFDNLMEDEVLKAEIVKCMALIGPGPHIIMYVIKIGRYTKEDIETADKLLQILDGNPFKYMIIVFTGRDDLEYHKDTPENYLLSVTPEFKTFAKKCDDRIIFVSNRSNDPDREWIDIYTAIEKLVSANSSYYKGELLEKIQEVKDELIDKIQQEDKHATREEAEDRVDKDIEKGGNSLIFMLGMPVVGAVVGGVISAFVAISLPVVAATGAIVGGGVVIAKRKLCTIS
ncbi:Hypothetical predicted protein [Mytilus galloprovincialis]|uniref:AIG1-type G domain-containing protein n=1 Tax=Mytilus galloprovincialis TaxID=29158 RepID=A0A8B6G715_MYTGA|nr:Hypothetical predicted protein [Mytilus galloprovincialis]